MAATFEYGAVVGQPESDTAGVAVLRNGGNAIDAAVTSALLACVVAPSSTGIGGYGGVLTACVNGEVVCIDFNTVAPQAATPMMFQVARSDGRFGSVVKDFANEIGPLAVSVPGVLAGMDLALKEFGTLTLSQALQPAIRACEKGFRVSATFANAVASREPKFRAFPDTARLLLEGGEAPEVGARVQNKALGQILTRVAEKGVEEFYGGRIAERIVKHIQETGGILTKEDFEAYEARVVEPVHNQCMEYEVYSSPLCSAGLSLVQMCALSDESELDLYAREPGKLAHGMIEILRAAWMDRYRHFGDPRSVDVPVETLMSDIHLGATAKEIAGHVSKGTRGQSLLRPLYAGGTTHISTVDSRRNMAALTLTHGPSFGSLVTIPRMGLIMNSGMSRFDPGSGLKNSVGPGKSPIMNMCPAIVMQDDQPFMTLGASGGTRIPSSMFQVLARRLVLEEDLEWSISAPRVHAEGNEWVCMEDTFGEAAPDYVKSVGYDLNKKGSAAARIRAIEVTEDNELLAVYDSRMKTREKGY